MFPVALSLDSVHTRIASYEVRAVLDWSKHALALLEHGLAFDASTSKQMIGLPPTHVVFSASVEVMAVSREWYFESYQDFGGVPETRTRKKQ